MPRGNPLAESLEVKPSKFAYSRVTRSCDSLRATTTTVERGVSHSFRINRGLGKSSKANEEPVDAAEILPAIFNVSSRHKAIRLHPSFLLLFEVPAKTLTSFGRRSCPWSSHRFRASSATIVAVFASAFALFVLHVVDEAWFRGWVSCRIDWVSAFGEGVDSNRVTSWSLAFPFENTCTSVCAIDWKFC